MNEAVVEATLSVEQYDARWNAPISSNHTAGPPMSVTLSYPPAASQLANLSVTAQAYLAPAAIAVNKPVPRTTHSLQRADSDESHVDAEWLMSITVLRLCYGMMI